MKLSFFGAAQEVSGSNFLFETGAAKILIDCGLFHCPVFCGPKNDSPFPYDSRGIDVVFITHAHIDHIGRLPKLVKDGYGGKIYSTPATRDFAELMLTDSLGILEKEARRENKNILFNENDVRLLMERWETVDYHQKLKTRDFDVIFRDAGHILGSAIVEIAANGKKIVFTGDLGNPPTPLLRPTEDILEANILLVDATYGNQIHEDKSERKLKLERIIENTANKKGVLLIPAFSLERTQEIIFELNDLVEKNRVPAMPVFVDSPLAIKLIPVYKKYDKYYNKEAKYIINSGDDIFKFPDLKFSLTTEESKEINGMAPPKIIIAGSGMMQGGRILHHAKRYLGDKKNTILFIGFQAAGSLGRKIKDGEKNIKIFGEKIRVEAKIEEIKGYSAHPDREQVFNFIQKTRETLEKCFPIHSEPQSALFLTQRIRDHLGVNTIIPKYGESFEI